MTYFKDWGSPEFEESLGLAIQDAYAGLEWPSEELNLPAEYETIHLDVVENVSNIQVVDVRQLPDSRFLMSAEACLVCIFDVFIYKPDYFLIEDDPRISVFDPDWNRHYLLAELNLSMQSNLDIVLDASDRERLELEVLSVEPIIPEDERIEVASRHRYRR